MTSTATIFRVTEQDQVPGPGTYSVPSDIGNAQKFTIKGRYPDTRKTGPGYENLPTTIGEGHKYSLYSRPEDPKPKSSPGPNYIPPPIGADAPASSFHIRGSKKERNDSPGPKYNTRRRNDGLQYSIKGRNFIEDARHDGPGPKYVPNYDASLPSPRRTTIRDVIRHKDSNDNPGPGRYEIDRSLDSRPASFHARCGTERKNDNPGPGKYEPEKYWKKDTPSFSLRSRHDIPDRSARAPYQKIPDTMGQGLKYSLTSRRDTRQREPPPGPSYMPPPFGSDGIKYSLTSRRDRKRDPSKEPPGPKYNINECNIDNCSRKYTIKGRNFSCDEGKAFSPGPAYKPEYGAVLPSPRRTQILEKVKDPKKPVGPGYYDLGSTMGQGPKITIGNKEKLAVRPGIG
ncbi:hypothetical protein TRFO_07538 [Tritrichomonas foetus]|uniref:Outer dense fiber protein 3 n=1 Tax=Tritrichomonas foetus TaxID=1144522 RepID=A0A1J4JWF7_9EUKA|nr:hypothetical protein TRFO_07538 [Tritrichomonas foetus]|eukprot:OHT01621.1 hypothetical protein TRFO_07538 [Tritrichomonas foetus]